MEKSQYMLEFEKRLRDLEGQLESLKKLCTDNKVEVENEILGIQKKIDTTKRRIYLNLSPWQKVQLARHPRRPFALDYISSIFQGFQELHGDRRFMNDRAIVGGPAFFDGHAVMIIGQQKGRNTKENLLRNFGSPHPEGYRKALRLMKMAEKFHLPIICFIDTPGAYPGIGAEERHVAEAIALNIYEMSLLEVPTIAVILGEGGSGGALGIGLADRVLILENAYYSVISPEGCAAILWKDRANAPEAAKALNLGADDLRKFKVVDEIVDEPLGGAHADPLLAAKNLQSTLHRHFHELRKEDPGERVARRYEKYRSMGIYRDSDSSPIEG